MKILKNNEKERIKSAIVDCIEIVKNDFDNHGSDKDIEARAKTIFILIQALNSL